MSQHHSNPWLTRPAVLLTAAAMLVVTAASQTLSGGGRELIVPRRDGFNALLHTGWKTTPAGRSVATGDYILSGQVSPDGKLFAYTNTGFEPHTLHIVDLATEKEIAAIPLRQAWSGLAFTPDSRRIFVSGGGANPFRDIWYIDRWDGVGWTSSVAFGGSGLTLHGAEKATTAVAALAVSPDGALLYALNNSDGQLYVLEANASGRAVARLTVGDHPIAATLSKDGRTLYVANLGDDTVVAVDVADPERPAITATFATDDHPNDLALSDDGRLFVSCGNTNHVVAFDLRSRERLEVLDTAPGPMAPPGSTPVSVALSPDQRTLYVANADNNDIVVFDVSDRRQSRPLGRMPTGYYPTLVRPTPDGKRLIVASSMGVGSGPSRVKRPVSAALSEDGYQHYTFNGLLSFIDAPNAQQLGAYTKQVTENTPYRDELLEQSGATAESIVPRRVGQASPIKHVIMIATENRTYDQVFGDLKQGNGDPSLVIFGRDTTPNQHALAEQFVLLDNFYFREKHFGWQAGAYQSDFEQRKFAIDYSSRGRLVGGASATEPATPYIWELAQAHKLTAMTFGGWFYGMRGVQAIASARFNPPGQPMPRDFELADRFIEELHDMDRRGAVPSLMVLMLSENHTNGNRPGSLSPRAMVASNDLAIGKIVEAVTKSSIWPTTAILTLEDDSQGGPDHVDSHRMIGLVVSPYAKRGSVDSTFYPAPSLVRTIELLLGLPPMTQHDAAAPPMANSFTTTPDLSGFTALPPRIDLREKNPPHAYSIAIR